MPNNAPTFSVGDGRVTTPIGSGSDHGHGVILQAGGKILVGGYSATTGTNGNQDYALVRYNSDGSLDTSFGGGDGKVTTPLGTGNDQGLALVPWEDGGFLLAGYSQVVTDPEATPPTVEYVYSAARYLANGTLDTSFGTGGKLVTTLTESYTHVHGATLQPDGKLLVTGQGVLIRYNVDGTVDLDSEAPPELEFHDAAYFSSTIVATGTRWENSVGSAVVVFLPAEAGEAIGLTIPTQGAFGEGRSIAIQADGKVLVSGLVERDGEIKLLLARIDDNLMMDTEFGTGGVVELGFGAGTSAVGEQVLVQEDGKVLVAGNGTAGVLLARFNTDGTLDTSFGDEGIVTMPTGIGYDAALQEDGKIVVTGTVFVGGQSDILVLRYNADGSLDRSFDGTNTLGGTITVNERGQPVVLDADVAIYDAEFAEYGNYGGTTLTLQRAGEPDAGDVFSGSGSLVLGAVEGDVTVGGTVIGTVTQKGNGTLAILFNEAATETLVNTAMRQIAYNNTSNTPDVTVQIVWSFSDGSATGTGTTTVNITSVQGTSGDDVLAGTAQADTMEGLAGNDSLAGEGGNDIIEGGDGADTLHGGTGNDTMTGGTGDDLYVVQQAGDVVTELAGGGTDLVWSYLTDYTLGAYVENGRIGSTASANLTGNNVANVLFAGRGDNVLDGLSGVDTVSYATGALAGVQASLASSSAQATGGSGSDTLLRIENLVGSNFGDQLTGNSAVNRIDGGAGDDMIDGGAGADVMLGGTGNDTFTVRDAGDLVTELAGGGTDLVNSYLASYVLGSGIENGRIRATDGAQLTGNGIANVLHAGTGNDTLDGGVASDTVAYTFGTTAGVQVNLTIQQVTGGSGTDTLVSIENVTGSAYGDLLQGSSGSNTLVGANGADTLIGGGGADVLVGGVGNDSLTGGTGADTFRIEATLSTSYNTDTITDFVSGTDMIELDAAVFAGLSTGALAAAAFRANATGTAADASDRIVYNTTTGALTFDADGNGAGVAVRFANLAAAPALEGGDFVVG